MKKILYIALGAVVLLSGGFYLFNNYNTDSVEIIKAPAEMMSTAYEGVLPCASCEGIATKLELMHKGDMMDKGNFVLTQVYLGEESNSFTEEGAWSISSDMKTLELTEAGSAKITRFAVLDENTVRLLGDDGTAFDSALPYNLVKVSAN